MKTNTFYILACFVISSFLLSSCLKDDDYTPSPVAGLTMVNGYSNDEGVIYYIDQRPVLPLEYKNFTEQPVIVYSGSRNILIKEGNSSKTIADTTLSIKDSTYYSSFTFGTESEPMHVITEDKVSQMAPAVESAGIRFFNLAEISGKVSLQIGAEEIKAPFKDRAVENQLTATTNQGFTSHVNGTFNLSIKNEAGAVIATRESVQLEVNRYYSIILIGKKDNSTTPLYIGIVNQVVN